MADSEDPPPTDPKSPKDEVPKAEPAKPERQRGGWFAKFAPGVRKLVSKRETPENLWIKDPDTGDMIFRSDLEAALWVTPGGKHMRIGPALRFKYTFDNGAWQAIPTPAAMDDPLNFVDDKSYKDRLAQARKTTGEQDAMAIGFGKIGGAPSVVLVQDFAFMGGSLGMAAGEAFIAAAQEAVKRKAPLVVFPASGGARMQEGALSLMQMARTTLAIQDLRHAHLPYVVVLTDPTTGGVTASYAMLGDVHLAEPGALIAFTGSRVIEQTIRETLPEGFQRSEYLMDKGVIDAVVARKDLPEVLASILRTLMAGRACGARAA